MSRDLESEIEEIKEEINDHQYNIDDLEDRISYFEDKENKIEDYKVFLYPAEIKKYIQNLITLQSKDDDDIHKFYPANNINVKEYFDDLSFDFKKIKYNNKIPSNDLDYITKIISNQGWSGFYYLENLSNNIELNKPIILYYGIIQLGAFYSNLHFNFTDQNTDILKIKNIRSHGLDSSELKNISFKINIDDLLLKTIKLEKVGLASRFALTYCSNYLDLFTRQESLSLFDILKNYFTEREHCFIKSQFLKDYGHYKPKIVIKSKLFNLYLFSFYLSILSRYKIQAWMKLLEDRKTNIKYYIEYFLKYGKLEFLTAIFDNIYIYRDKIPSIAKTSSVMTI